jgi:hypothetical protein
MAFTQTIHKASAAAPPAGNTPCNMDAGQAKQARLMPPAAHIQPQDAYSIALQYVTVFYPRWFTYTQSSLGPCNQLIGPVRISPIYHAVVAINDDTVYASTFVGVKKEPTIVTVPATSTNYSVLQLDQYGTVFAGIPDNKPGIFGLVPPEWQGTLPPNVTPIPVPYDYTELIFRADKYVNNVDMRQEADKFRRALHAASLSDWMNDPNSGPADILAEAYFAFPYKGLAVGLIDYAPLAFLVSLQTAVHAATTQAPSQEEQMLSDAFDQAFQDPTNYPLLIAGTQDAQKAFDANYLAQVYPDTTWITMTDIGDWATDPQGYLNRASLTNNIQYGNNHTAAVYYHAFYDTNKNRLDGSKASYTITFPRGQQPDVKRFWSLTAYMGVGVELVPNDDNKYVVASYTPNLVTEDDGSVKVLLSNQLPPNFPESNWLPIPLGPFSVMLRAYGPQNPVFKLNGSTYNNTYAPPPVTPVQ